jgi:hypothetical protein
LGVAAPLGSVIVPVMSPEVIDCANAVVIVVTNRHAPKRGSNRGLTM